MSTPALRLLPAADVPAPAALRPAPALRLVLAWPAAPMPVLARPGLTPFMRRCLLLALLMHVWLVLMLGNAPGGTAAPGQGVAGTLNITLRGPETPGATQQALPPAPAVPEGPSGSAAQPRWGGQVRAQAPVAVAEPGAAQLGRWAAEPAPAPPAAVPPPPPGRVVEERAAAEPPAVPPAAPSPSATTETLSTLRAPAAVATAPSWGALPPETPVALPPPAERSLLAPPARALPPAAPDLAPLAPAPALPPVALEAPALTPLLQRLARPATPRAEPDPEPAAALKPEPVVAAPVPLSLPALPALQVPVLPPAPELPAAAGPARVTPPVLAAEPKVAPAATLAPTPTASPTATPNAAPTAAPTAATALPVRAGLPDAGPQLGRDVATPPAPAASVLPRLNLTLQRPRGGELSRGRSAGALPVLPRLPEVDEKLGRDIAKSAKADCREAYRGVGLAAAVPLAADALKKDAGCKW